MTREQLLEWQKKYKSLIKWETFLMWLGVVLFINIVLTDLWIGFTHPEKLTPGFIAFHGLLMGMNILQAFNCKSDREDLKRTLRGIEMRLEEYEQV